MRHLSRYPETSTPATKGLFDHALPCGFWRSSENLDNRKLKKDYRLDLYGFKVALTFPGH